MKIGSMQDKVVLVTGSTDGIGKETARKLAALGAKVLLHGHDRIREGEAAEDIRRSTGNQNVDTLVADFRSLAEVGHLADEIRKTYPTLQILINNAGVFSSQRCLTEDGFEQTFQVQYLAPFLLTALLRDRLESIRPSRIVNVTSVLHKGADLDFSNLQGERGYDGYAAYASSKLALTLFTFELASQLQGTGVKVNCVHPGRVNTKLVRAGYGKGPGLTPAQGAEAPFMLAVDPRLKNASSRYFERDRPADPDPRAFDIQLRKKLWDYTESLIQGRTAKVA